jgi:putative transposon-encoded protein
MKDEVVLPTSVHVEDVEKVFKKRVKRLGNTGYVSIHKKNIGKEVLVIVPKGETLKAKKVLRA